MHRNNQDVFARLLTSNKHIKEVQMKRETLFKTIFILLSISLLLPFSRIILVGHVVNLNAWINLMLFLILFTYYLFMKRKSIFTIIFFLCFTFYIFLGFYRTNDSQVTFSHVFTYFPFIIAILIQEINVRYDVKKVLIYFTICAAISSFSAILIQYFYQNVFYSINYDIDVSSIESKLEWGRISWIGSAVALPLIAQIGFLNIFSKKEKYIISISLISIVLGLVFTFNRTFLLAFTFLMLYVVLINTGKFRFKILVVVSLLLFLSILVINNLKDFVPNLENLIDYRILGFFKGQSSIKGDIESRQILYNQYIENILNNNLLGQGFGLPFSTIPEPRAWSDVTLISFLIPMGFIGVILFVIFLIKILIKIKRNIDNNQVKKLYIVVLLLSILVSFNDDIWSHKNFPIIFVFMINSFQLINLNHKQQKI